MITRQLLAGASALAILASASAASAQSNTNNETSTGGTGNASFCNNNGTATNSTCTISQNGSNNRSQVNQNGDAQSATSQQTGDRNQSDITQRDNRNRATVTQNGNNGASFVEQTGSFNSASVTQTSPRGANTAGDQTSVLQQSTVAAAGATGTGNTVTVNQTRTSTVAGTANFAQIQQRGTNSGTVSQSGFGHVSNSIQGGTVPFGGGAGTNTGSGNSISVTQSGANTNSFIQQQGFGGAGFDDVRNNSATVDLRDGANTSQINQRSSGNLARVFVFGGNLNTRAGVAQEINTSVVRQRNSAVASTVASNNEVFVSLARGDDLISDLTQDGTDNYGEVVMTSGLSGNDPAVAPDPTAGLNGGNNSTLTQNGRGSTAQVTIGAQRGASFLGFGNTSNITQTGSAAFSGRGPARTTDEGSAATADRIAISEFAGGEGDRARGNFVQTFQYGRFGNIGVTQNSDANSGQVAPDGSVARSRASVFQGGERNVATVGQTGDNFADVTQGRNNTVDTGNNVSLTQTDAGDGAGTTTGTDPFGNPITTGTTRQFNVATVTQNGVGNQFTAVQNTRDGFINGFQAVGSTRLVADIEQGTGTAGGVGAAAPAAQTGAGTQRQTINLSQGGNGNGAQIRQSGTDLVVTVSQLGTNAAAAGSFGGAGGGFATGADQGQATGNLVRINQQGTRNRATARQLAGVGRSTGTAADTAPASGNSAAQNAANGDPAVADEFFFAGGPRSAEATILQTGTDNIGEIDQAGLGQFARIEQNGLRNRADIDQRTAAVNATAVIRQNGNDNSYFIVQDRPGQFIVVEQTGNANVATNVTQRGPASGSNGVNPPTP